jgi:hypothetical protein
MRETPRSLRLYFGICAVLQILGALALLSSLTIYGVVFGVVSLGLGAFLGYIAFRLPQLLLGSARLVTVALGVEVGFSLVNAVIALIFHASIGSVVFQLVLVIAVSAYLYRSVQRLSAEAHQGVGAMPPGQMAAPPGYGAPQPQQLQYAPSPYAAPHAAAPQYGQPQTGPMGYGQPPQQMQQQPLGPGMVAGPRPRSCRSRTGSSSAPRR